MWDRACRSPLQAQPCSIAVSSQRCRWCCQVKRCTAISISAGGWRFGGSALCRQSRVRKVIGCARCTGCAGCTGCVRCTGWAGCGGCNGCSDAGQAGSVNLRTEASARASRIDHARRLRRDTGHQLRALFTCAGNEWLRWALPAALAGSPRWPARMRHWIPARSTLAQSHPGMWSCRSRPSRCWPRLKTSHARYRRSASAGTSCSTHAHSETTKYKRFLTGR